MKFIIGILGAALALSCTPQSLNAQSETSAEKKAPVAESAPVTYRLTYSLTEMDGNKQLSVQHFTLTMNPASKDGFMMRDGNIKIGSRVPIVVGSSDPEKSSHTDVQYQDVGLHIDVRMKEVANGIQILSTFNQTAIEEASALAGTNFPFIRQTVLESSSVLTLGKPIMIGSLDIPNSTRHLDIAVLIESVH